MVAGRGMGGGRVCTAEDALAPKTARLRATIEDGTAAYTRCVWDAVSRTRDHRVGWQSVFAVRVRCGGVETGRVLAGGGLGSMYNGRIEMTRKCACLAMPPMAHLVVRKIVAAWGWRAFC
eukprot:6893388-Prymnesium_polylepis.1